MITKDKDIYFLTILFCLNISFGSDFNDDGVDLSSGNYNFIVNHNPICMEIRCFSIFESNQLNNNLK